MRGLPNKRFELTHVSYTACESARSPLKRNTLDAWKNAKASIPPTRGRCLLAYHIDDAGITLDDLRKRIEATDLIPSRVPLLDGIDATFSALAAHGLMTLAQLRNELGSAKRLGALAQDAGVDAQYLTLLRREIESYFPRPAALGAFDWLPRDEIAKLEKGGVRDTAALRARTESAQDRFQLVETTGVDAAVLGSLAQLADLMRVQWVSPTTARVLVEARYGSASKVAAADAADLCDRIARANQGGRFFKGRIGLRDVSRLVRAAGYVSD
jgi:hypothetical protein